MSDLAADKWVRIMADFCAEGVWCKNGAGTCVSGLPVTPALRARIIEWQHWYDDECEDYMPPSERKTEFDPVEFGAEGLEIAREVKRQLPGWTIIYFDESKLDRERPRVEYEYEVAG